MASYTPPVISGYNATPPPDDGTQSAANQVKWSTIKTKLADPVKTFVDDNITEITTAFTTVDAALIEAGTKMLFYQATAPTGWTQDTTASLDDHALRVVTTTGWTGGTQGTSPFTAVFAVAATDSAAADLAAHTHTFSATSGAGTAHGHTMTIRERSTGGSSQALFAGTLVANALAFNTHTNTTVQAATEAAHTHAVSGTTASNGAGGGHIHGIELRVKYLDMIIASKD